MIVVLKRFLLQLLLIVAVVTCVAQKPAVHNDLFFDNFKGPVQSVKTIPYTVNENGQVGAVDSCCVSLLEYDNKGYRTLALDQDPRSKEMDGQVYSKRFGNGKVKEIQFRMNGKLVSTLLGTVDKKGNYGHSKVVDSSGKLLSYYTEVKVNEYGKIVSMKQISTDSILQRTIVNIYDKHIWIGGVIKDSSGREVYSTDIKLNKSMNPTRLVVTRETGGISSVIITTYEYDFFDEHGNWIQRRELNDKGQIRKIVKREIHYRDN